MTEQISKLEAEILNLQAAEQAIMDQADMTYRKNSEEMSARIKAQGYKGVVIQSSPAKFIDGRLNSIISIDAPAKYRNDKFIEAVIEEAKALNDEKFKGLTSRAWGIKRKIADRMSELAAFTEIEAVRPGYDDHFHLFTFCGGKIYTGQVNDTGAADVYLDTGTIDPEHVEKFKAANFCPLYIAKHQSAIVSYVEIIAHAIAEVVKATGKK